MESKEVKPGRDALRAVIRGHLVRCHRTINQDHPEVARMSPRNAADFLLHLQDTGRIKIELYNETAVTSGAGLSRRSGRTGRNKARCSV